MDKNGGKLETVGEIGGEKTANLEYKEVTT